MTNRIPCTLGYKTVETPTSVTVHTGADDCGIVLVFEGDRWVYLETDAARRLADSIKGLSRWLP